IAKVRTRCLPKQHDGQSTDVSRTSERNVYVCTSRWCYSVLDLEYSRTIHLAADTTRAIGRCAGKEKCPSTVFASQFTDLLQIKHFADRHTPQGQQVLMQLVRFS